MVHNVALYCLGDAHDDLSCMLSVPPMVHYDCDVASQDAVARYETMLQWVNVTDRVMHCITV